MLEWMAVIRMVSPKRMTSTWWPRRCLTLPTWRAWSRTKRTKAGKSRSMRRKRRRRIRCSGEGAAVAAVAGEAAVVAAAGGEAKRAPRSHCNGGGGGPSAMTWTPTMTQPSPRRSCPPAACACAAQEAGSGPGGGPPSPPLRTCPTWGSTAGSTEPHLPRRCTQTFSAMAALAVPACRPPSGPCGAAAGRYAAARTGGVAAGAGTTRDPGSSPVKAAASSLLSHMGTRPAWGGSTGWVAAAVLSRV